VKTTIRFVLGAAIAVIVVAVCGIVAMIWPFLQALRIEPLEALKAVFR
jgi:ABC-type antimicrobial peptide transport system permease subunit